MPHVHVLALIEHSNVDDEIEERLGAILYPHAYYFEFSPVTVPCECIWSSDEGIDAANRTVGDFHKLWHAFHSTPEAHRLQWTTFIKEWEDTASQTTRSSPHAKPPDPQCDVCYGSGTFITTTPPTGLRYEAWAPNQWEKLGRASEISIDPGQFDSIVTPDGQAYTRYHILRSQSAEEWAEHTRMLLRHHADQLAIRCFVNK